MQSQQHRAPEAELASCCLYSDWDVDRTTMAQKYMLDRPKIPRSSEQRGGGVKACNDLRGRPCQTRRALLSDALPQILNAASSAFRILTWTPDSLAQLCELWAVHRTASCEDALAPGNKEEVGLAILCFPKPFHSPQKQTSRAELSSEPGSRVAVVGSCHRLALPRKEYEDAIIPIYTLHRLCSKVVNQATHAILELLFTTAFRATESCWSSVTQGRSHHSHSALL